jgi:hypothetical protein
LLSGNEPRTRRCKVTGIDKEREKIKVEVGFATEPGLGRLRGGVQVQFYSGGGWLTPRLGRERYPVPIL